MFRRPILAEARDLLFVGGIAAWALGLVGIAAGFHPLVSESLHGAHLTGASRSGGSGPLTLAPMPDLAAPPSQFLFTPAAPPVLVTAPRRPPQVRRSIPGEGAGHRDAMRLDGDGPRFLMETSQLQTRRGWRDAGAVASARFNAYVQAPPPTSTASLP